MISSKLIFDWKVDQFGWPTKAKARLVARGDMQREYIDFGDLYAPTVASSSVRLLAALACEHDLELCHFDIDQAFVRADLAEDVYMRLPEGCGSLSGKVVKLSKSLYGLRQASRQWYALLKKCLLALGFVQCLADSCVRLVEGGKVVMHLVVHVDDILPWERRKGVISSVRISDVSFQSSRWASSSGTRGAFTRETGRQKG